MTPKGKKVCLDAYNCFLKHKALIACRGYRKVDSYDKVVKSVYYKLFFSLTHKFIGAGIIELKDLEIFYEKARIHSIEDFEPSSFVASFDRINEIKYEKKSLVDICKEIEESVDFISKQLEEQELELVDFTTGKPPILMKFWKMGYIDVYTMLCIIDYKTVSKQSWFKIICGNKKADITIALKSIKMHSEIKEVVLEFLSKKALTI